MSVRKRKHNDEESGFTFYCDLYKIKRKCQEEDEEVILREAANSWLTLSDLEKRKVFAKFKQYKLKSMELFARKLKNVQPYMKKKVNNRNHESTWNNDSLVNSFNNSKSESEIMNIEDNSMGSFSGDIDVSASNENNSNQLCNEVNEPKLDETEYNNMCSEVNEEINIQLNRVTESPINNEVMETRCEDQNKEMLILKPREPPPPVRCAKELYTMLKGHLAAPYSSLLSSEKKIYVNALRTLKKQYILNYMAYLHSLSSEELLNYYHN